MLEIWHADELVDVAQLLTTELIVNVVRHAVTSIDLSISWDDPSLRVEVHDGSSTLPVVVDEPGEGGGYGLRLISELARAWGVTQTDNGKIVWFTVERGDGMAQAEGS
jgi:two-component sensor histidine kinase